MLPPEFDSVGFDRCWVGPSSLGFRTQHRSGDCGDKRLHENEQGAGYVGEDLWPMQQSQREMQMVTQGLQGEICSGRDFSLDKMLGFGFSSDFCLDRVVSGGIAEAELQETENFDVTTVLKEGSFHRYHGCDSSDTRFSVPISDANERFSLTGYPIHNAVAATKDTKSIETVISSSAEATPLRTPNSETRKALYNQEKDPGFGMSASAAPTATLDRQDLRTETIRPELANVDYDWPLAFYATAYLGSGTAKINSKRSRASNKLPIRILVVDATNFRSMVQKLTGIQASHPMQPGEFHLYRAPSAISTVKPQSADGNPIIGGFPTLDTSAFLLLHDTSASNSAARLP
eukprot:c20176_g1_i1 orf=281-1318(+)